MKEYARKPYLFTGSYQEMMRTDMDFQSIDKKHSVFKKPYLDDKTDFLEMEARSDPPSGMPIYFSVKPKIPPEVVVFNCFFSSCHIPGERRKHRLACTQYIMDIAAWSWDIEKVEAFYWYIHGQKVVTMDLQPKSTAEGSIQFVVTMDGGGGTRGRYYLTVPECSADCDCSGSSIDIGSYQMSVGASQNLSVATPDTDCTYSWAVTGGGGSVSPATGTTTTYTAPASNANCANNPTISLRCQGVEIDTVQIAVNEYAGGDNAYFIIQECNYSNFTSDWCSVEVVRRYYNCDGSFDSTQGAQYCDGVYRCPGGIPCACEDNPDEASCASCINSYYPGQGVGSVVDIRTGDMITNGCCPAALL